MKYQQRKNTVDCNQAYDSNKQLRAINVKVNNNNNDDDDLK